MTRISGARTAISLVLATLSAACGGDSTGTGADASGDTQTTPQPLGASCAKDADCLTRICLKSQYGTPFCSRPCTTAWEPCPAGDDAAEGAALCVSYEDLPNPDAPAFQGDLERFCVPRCSASDACEAIDLAWETCDIPRWLGDPVFPALGNVKVCGSPSFHGKVPVDPSQCDWEKTINPKFANEANLCRSYCAYLDACKEIPVSADLRCCEWGCYNRIVVDDAVVDAWNDEIKCYLDNHGAFPDDGPQNSCTEPPKHCGGTPEDPTPPAARP